MSLMIWKKIARVKLKTTEVLASCNRNRLRTRRSKVTRSIASVSSVQNSIRPLRRRIKL